MDLHCHLDLYPSPAEVVQEIDRRNLTVFSVTTTPSAYLKTKALAEHSKSIFTGIGLHPQIVSQRFGELNQIERHIERADFVGEIGLDGGPEHKNSWDKQVTVFRKALELAETAGGKVLSIHSRRAAEPVITELLKGNGNNTPILHWFSGSKKQLNAAIEAGCWFSVGPAMLAGAKGRELLAKIPLDRVVLETDGPFTQKNNIPYKPWDALELCQPILCDIYEITAIEAEENLSRNLAIILEIMRKN